MRPYATSVCVAGLKNAFAPPRRRRRRRGCSRVYLEMCDAWLLLTRHGPDGARAHTGYAYGSMARACNPEERSNPTPRALFLQPPEEHRNARRRSAALGSRTYAHAESAHEVTRPPVFICHVIVLRLFLFCAPTRRKKQKQYPPPNIASRNLNASTALSDDPQEAGRHRQHARR